MCSQLTSKELFPLSKLLNICTSAWWTAVNTEEGAGFGGAAHTSVEEIAQELCWPHALLTSSSTEHSPESHGQFAVGLLTQI